MKFNINLSSTKECISLEHAESLYQDGRINENNIELLRELYADENFIPVAYNNWAATFIVSPSKKRTKEEDVMAEIYTAMQHLLNINGENIANSPTDKIMSIVNDNIKLAKVENIQDVFFRKALGAAYKYGDEQLYSLSVTVDKPIYVKGTNEKEIFLDLGEWKAGVIAKSDSFSEAEISNMLQRIICHIILKRGITKFSAMTEEQLQQIFNKYLNNKDLIIRCVNIVQAQTMDASNQEQDSNQPLK